MNVSRYLALQPPSSKRLEKKITTSFVKYNGASDNTSNNTCVLGSGARNSAKLEFYSAVKVCSTKLLLTVNC